VVVGNFSIVPINGTVTFPTAGTWYDYLGNATYTTTGTAQNINLAPGEFHVYLNRNINNIIGTPVVDLPWNGTTLEARLYPNPASSQFVTEISLPQAGVVRVELYNSLGQFVTTLHNGFLPKGVQQVRAGNLQLGHGAYFIRINTKTANKTISVTIQ
jgi:hypothetical protein